MFVHEMVHNRRMALTVLHELFLYGIAYWAFSFYQAIALAKREM